MSLLPRTAWLAIGAIVAALGASSGAFDLGVPPMVAGAIGGLAILGAIGSGRLGRAAIAAFLVGLGTVLLRAGLALLIGGSIASAEPLPVGSGLRTAEVVDVSSPSGSEQRGFLRVAPDDADGQGWLVYAWLPRHPALVPGDMVAVRGTLEEPPQDAPGFSGFLESRGAVGTMKAHSLELLAAGSGALASIEQMRWAIDGALSRALPEPEAGLAAGILIGLRERVSRHVADAFTVTGLTHVVAISGWNIALVAGIATGLLRATGLGRRPRSLIVIAAIVGYTILAGAEASVIRAAAMGGVVLMARESGRPSGAAAALGIACWALLLVEPRMIDDIGLQLSLAATAGLLALGGRAESAVRGLSAGRAPRWFCETLGISLAAQLSTLPLILLHFGRLSLISPLANLLVAPVVPLAMLGAAIGVLIGPLLVIPPIGLILAPLALTAWLPLMLMTRGADLLAEVPLANVELLPPFDLIGALVALLALVAVLRRVLAGRAPPAAARQWRTPTLVPPAPEGASRGRKVAAVGASLGLVAVFALVLVSRPGGRLQVTVLDIGQGDAILLEASDGSRVLVDGGPDPDLLVRRLDERIPIWDRRIGLALLTHPHEDHSGGLAGLAPRYRIDRIGETGMASEGAGVKGLRTTAARLGIGRVRLAQGDQLSLGEARIVVLWPPRAAIPDASPGSGRAINDTSIVLGVSIGRQRLLLTGDLEEDRDADLLDVLPRDGRRWDLLKVAHHGSATASSRPLLDVLRPRLAAISVGAENRYGHPAAATLARLSDVGAKVWRTDRQGTLSLSLDGEPRTTAAMLRGPARPPCPAGSPPAPTPAADGRDACYARPDGGPHPSRSALTAHVHRALGAPAAAHDGGRRGGFLPGLPRHQGRRVRRSTPGRDSRAPP